MFQFKLKKFYMSCTLLFSLHIFAEDYRLEISRLKTDANLLPFLTRQIPAVQILPIFPHLGAVVNSSAQQDENRRHQAILDRLTSRSNFFRDGLYSLVFLSKIALRLHIQAMEKMAILMDEVRSYDYGVNEHKTLTNFYKKNKTIFTSIEETREYLLYLSRHGYLDTYPNMKQLRAMIMKCSYGPKNLRGFHSVISKRSDRLADHVCAEDDIECNICTNEFDSNKRRAKAFPCGHHACAICVEGLVRPECHLCRCPFDVRISDSI